MATDHLDYLIGEDDLTPENSKKGYGSCTEVKQRITYTWKNIDVFGEIPTQSSVFRNALNRVKFCVGLRHRAPTPRKHLIKNIAGIANAGEILAVMGSSGAGKTTLLNALAFRSPVGIQLSQSAELAFNGTEIGFEELSAHCAYVEQQDLFIGSLTAIEHLIFQAMLRMPKTIPYHQKVKKVDEVIAELSLVKCKNTMIGVPGRSKGLSGAERKKLAFAGESLTDPSLLFCDEPTSGLDSFMAHSVLQVLKRLAMKGKTMILTIHQPSSELFSLFDKLLLMAEGRVAFLGTPVEASNFFNQLSTPCPSNYNPADFYVQQLAVVPGNEHDSRENIRRICDTFASSDYAKDLHQAISNCNKVDDNAVNNFKKEVYKYRATWWTQFRAVLWSSWLNVLKEPFLVRLRLIQTVMVASLIGLIFFGQELNQDGVQNINGALFLFLTNMTFQNVFAVINVFCAELPIFLRESRSRLYSTDTYFLGKTLAELPLFLIVPLIFTSITYPMIGLRPTWPSFLIALALVTLVANVSTSAGNNRLAINVAVTEMSKQQIRGICMSKRIEGDVEMLTSIYCRLAEAIYELDSGQSNTDGFRNFVDSLDVTLKLERDFCTQLMNAVMDKANRSPICIISGGETTVNVKGNGIGGTNQELALRIAREIKKNATISDMVFLSAGTDGIDGPCDAAGAVASLQMANDCSKMENGAIDTYIESNDSYTLFKQLGAGKYHVLTGHTGTNVMDLHFMMIPLRSL